jgi:phenylalanine ammonia-lyase
MTLAAPGPDVTAAGEVRLDGHLTLGDVVRVARDRVPVRIADPAAAERRMLASCRYVDATIERGESLYGVTTGLGGMSDLPVPVDAAADLQRGLLWYHKAGSGPSLPAADVRAAMLIQAHAHLQGFSGVRPAIVDRLAALLNAGVTPCVPEQGSIGASGDLVPLTYVAGAAIGHDARFSVEVGGRVVEAPEALRRLGLAPLEPRPKEALAMINGTAMSTGIAANAVDGARVLLALAMGVHGLLVQALRGTNESFDPFIHDLKPHRGQRWAAATMLDLLDGSALSRDDLGRRHRASAGAGLAQDRYSLRCLPQFIGPIADGIAQVAASIETEVNAVTDNPVIDPQASVSRYGGNFLAEYVGVGMDHLRYYLGLLSKHLDTQIALLVAPEFSNGLPPSLVANGHRPVNMGLKGLQIAANSLMPLLGFLGNSIADRFPTHAEQFNQNVNSQGFNSANLARRSIDALRSYVAMALIFGVQGADLRGRALLGHYDARDALSPAGARLYMAARDIVARPPRRDRPYLWDDDDLPLDRHVALLAADIASAGRLPSAVAGIITAVEGLGR